MNKEIILDEHIDIEGFIKIVRYKHKVKLSDKFKYRVNKNRKYLEKLVNNNEIIYGVTTGFGENVNKIIDTKEAKILQYNIINSHSTSVGDYLNEEETRAVMLMVLLNSGKGYSGVRLETLERYQQFLNLNLHPFAPKEGSVGYLSIEAHIARAIIGEGKIIENNKILDASEVLKSINIDKYELSYKEGLSLISGTTSVTGLSIIAIYDILKATKTADIIGACTLEVLKANLNAFDKKAMKLRNQKYQIETAKNISKILEDSKILTKSSHNIQDALSLRCIPQLHGASKNTIYDAIKVLTNELNSCTDNPLIFSEVYDEKVISNGNPDSSYIGIEMDSVSIAATMIAKMCERRTNRLIDGSLSNLPWFLVKNPGLNSGLMITQYTQAGILNDMKILSTPSVIDNIPTCGNQEDYVAMGYNSAKKGLKIANYLEYVLAIELLCNMQAYHLIENKKSRITEKLFCRISKIVPYIENDVLLYEYIESLKSLIHEGDILNCVENEIGVIL